MHPNLIGHLEDEACSDTQCVAKSQCFHVAEQFVESGASMSGVVVWG